MKMDLFLLINYKRIVSLVLVIPDIGDRTTIVLRILLF